jgi:8-oxo-dGTP diphosphatase
MAKRTKAVVGFMFSEDTRKVALIRKRRPAFQAGLLNGVGGKVERGERPEAAMVREFFEETGVQTAVAAWKYVARILVSDWDIKFYCTTGDLSALKSTTDELIEVHNVSTLNFQSTLRNVQWLVPLCLDTSDYVLPITVRETNELVEVTKVLAAANPT